MKTFGNILAMIAGVFVIIIAWKIGGPILLLPGVGAGIAAAIGIKSWLDE